MKSGGSSILLMAAALLVVSGCAHFRDTRYSSGLQSWNRAEDSLATASKLQIRDQYEAGRTDSALATLWRWVETSGYGLVNYRTNIVLHIAAGCFSEGVYDESIIDNFLIERKLDRNHEATPYLPWYYPSIDWSFEPFTKRVAREVLPGTQPGSVEQLLCECFAGDCDSLFIKLRRPEYRETDLARYYRRETRRVLDHRSEGHLAAYSGVWMPQGDNEILGNHPVLGLEMGGKTNGYLYNLIGEVRLLDADESYVVQQNSRLDTAKSFIGYYVGLEAGRELIRSAQHEIYMCGGVGLDGFAYDNPVEGEPKRKVNAFSANVGVGYKFYPHRLSPGYIGVQASYNLMDYQRETGTELGGNAVSLRFLIGWSGNPPVNERLRNLDY